jgi:hypothetical protein
MLLTHLSLRLSAATIPARKKQFDVRWIFNAAAQLIHPDDGAGVVSVDTTPSNSPAAYQATVATLYAGLPRF